MSANSNDLIEQESEPEANGACGDDSDYREALELLYGRINYEQTASPSPRYPFRLQRMSELVSRLGLSEYLYTDENGIAASPRPPKPLVHIAGTKGKGSTASMVASILAAAGYRTGLYTSPHLNDLEERFCVNGAKCSKKQIVEMVRRIQPVIQAMDRQPSSAPTFFELTTAMAVLHFQMQACDAIVLEVGLGGRLDSTNVFASTVTAITSIGLDHQNVLGNSLEEIAAEKAGIIKPGVTLVSGVTKDSVAEVIHSKAKQRNAPVFQLGRDFDYQHEPDDEWGLRFRYLGDPSREKPQTPLDAVINLEGAHQAGNAAVAVAIVDQLTCPDTGRNSNASKITQRLTLSPSAIQQGLAEVRCNARIERFGLPDNVTAIIDSAHNHDSIAALVQTMENRFAARPKVVVFGTSRDKQAEPMLGELARIADRLILTRYSGNARARNPQDLLPTLPNDFRGSTVVIESASEAFVQALDKSTPDGVLIICGSFFLAAEARLWIEIQAARSTGASSP